MDVRHVCVCVGRYACLGGDGCEHLLQDARLTSTFKMASGALQVLGSLASLYV